MPMAYCHCIARQNLIFVGENIKLMPDKYELGRVFAMMKSDASLMAIATMMALIDWSPSRYFSTHTDDVTIDAAYAYQG